MHLNLLYSKKRLVTIFAYVLLVLFLGIAISSCSGDDGAVGPAGNANVIYSEWIVPTWSAGSFYGVAVQEYNITTTNLTQDVIDYGVVLMYWKNASSYIWQLPSSGLGGNIIIDFSFSENTLHLYIFDEVNGTLPSAIPSSNVFRYVLIPGNIPGNNSSDSQTEIITELKTAGVDIDDYHGVCDYYGINP